MHPRAAWSTEAHMLAGVIDLLAGANWQRAGKKSVPKPVPIKRPGDKARVGTSRTAAEFEAVYARAMAKVADVEQSGGTLLVSKRPEEVTDGR